MKPGMAMLTASVAAIGVGLALTGTLGAARIEAPAAEAEKPTPPRIGWGEPRDGLQIGLFPQTPQKAFRYGSTIAITMRVQNVSRMPIAFTMRAPEISTVTLGENGRLTLQTFGGTNKTAALRLAPGEIADLPGGRYRAQILAPGEDSPPKTEDALPVLALMPGEYQAECSFPIWIPDQNDASRATAHRAKPGVFAFKVQDNAPRSQAAKSHAVKAEKAVDSSIVWGETVNGLQGGLKRVTAEDMAALPPDKRKDMAEDEVLTWFYVRNTTGKPLRLSYSNFSDNDASYWVQDAQGKDCQVRTTFFTGMRAQSEHLLQPSAMLQMGEGAFTFHARPTPILVSDYMPTFTAEPGHYTLRLIGSARFAGINGFDMVFVSGSIPFVAPPQ